MILISKLIYPLNPSFLRQYLNFQKQLPQLQWIACCSNNSVNSFEVKGADGQGLLFCYSEWQATGGLNLMLATPNISPINGNKWINMLDTERFHAMSFCMASHAQRLQTCRPKRCRDLSSRPMQQTGKLGVTFEWERTQMTHCETYVWNKLRSCKTMYAYVIYNYVSMWWSI